MAMGRKKTQNILQGPARRFGCRVKVSYQVAIGG